MTESPVEPELEEKEIRRKNMMMLHYVRRVFWRCEQGEREEKSLSSSE